MKPETYVAGAVAVVGYALAFGLGEVYDWSNGEVGVGVMATIAVSTLVRAHLTFSREDRERDARGRTDVPST